MFSFICNVLKRIQNSVSGPCSLAWRNSMEGISRTGESWLHCWLLHVQPLQAGWSPGSSAEHANTELLWLCLLKTPNGSAGKESACNAGDTGSIPGSGRTLCRRKWQLTSVFLSEKSHGQRSLVGYSSKGCKVSDMTEWKNTHILRTPTYNNSTEYLLLVTGHWVYISLCSKNWTHITSFHLHSNLCHGLYF